MDELEIVPCLGKKKIYVYTLERVIKIEKRQELWKNLNKLFGQPNNIDSSIC